jgi:prepilin-type processing-associated H-X9-DG protein
MEILLPVLGIAYGAVFIWLAVRIINRPKEWGKAGTIIAIMLLLPLVGAFLLPARRSAGPAARRSQCKNNLKQIGIALYNYHEKFGSLPPAYIADQNGRPLHSWRVLLLPFLDQAPLYAQYRFDEPWDGPNNSKLADSIHSIYCCPSDDHGDLDHKLGRSTMTSYVAVVGADTAWPGHGASSFQDIKDGTSNTLLVVEVANSGIHWMEPRDLHVLQMTPTINAKSGQGMSSRHTGGAHGVFADGSVRFISDTLTADALRALITAHAGDATPDF